MMTKKKIIKNNQQWLEIKGKTSENKIKKKQMKNKLLKGKRQKKPKLKKNKLKLLRNLPKLIQKSMKRFNHRKKINMKMKPLMIGKIIWMKYSTKFQIQLLKLKFLSENMKVKIKILIWRMTNK